MQITKGQQIVSSEEIACWQKSTWDTLSADPELLAALQDPTRNFNQDETSIQIGNSSVVRTNSINLTEKIIHISLSFQPI